MPHTFGAVISYVCVQDPELKNLLNRQSCLGRLITSNIIIQHNNFSVRIVFNLNCWEKKIHIQNMYHKCLVKVDGWRFFNTLSSELPEQHPLKIPFKNISQNKMTMWFVFHSPSSFCYLYIINNFPQTFTFNIWSLMSECNFWEADELKYSLLLNEPAPSSR